MTISTAHRNETLRIMNNVVPKLIDRPLSDLDPVQREVYFRFTSLVLEEKKKLSPPSKIESVKQKEDSVCVGTIFDSRQYFLQF